MSARFTEPPGSISAARSVWMLPVGILAGSWVGIVFAVGATTPAALVDAAGSVAPVYWMHVFAESTYGAIIGAALGFPVGVVAFLALVAGRAVRFSRWLQAAAACASATSCVAVGGILVVGPRVEQIALVSLAGVAAVGCVSAIAAVDASLSRRE
ncbi:hypothetical protein [Herbiconiux liangxiaofengii]|uniref:hypothetical protein n=1 Tax=Herbiconiux liangxiaofengii TaxID=3342795 RepID=UPI0035B7DECD